MGIIAGLKAQSYIHLGGGQGYSVPASHSVVYQSPWLDEIAASTGRTVTDRTALTFVPFFAGVRLISESVGRLPLVLYLRKGDDDRERARDKQLYGMLHDEPNPEMSAMVFREAMQGHMITRGNCFAERQRDELGRDKYLWPLRPDRMQVLLNSETGKKFYRYRIETLGDTINLTTDRVFHVPSFGYDGRVGYSLVSLFREAISLGLTTQEFGARYFRSGASPSAVVTHPKGWSEDTRTNFITSLKQKNEGLTNAQRIAVIEEGVTWEKVGFNLDDSQFLETRKFQRGEAAIMLNLPPHMIGDVERSTSWGTGIEEQTLGFVTYSLGSWLERWTQESNRQLVRPAYGNTHYAEFLVDALLKGRAEDRMAAYEALQRMGVINADTIAAKENLPKPADGSGGRYYRSIQIEPVDAVSAGNDAPDVPTDALETIAGSPKSAASRIALASMPSARSIAREIVKAGGGNGRTDGGNGS